jgi:hypothetical protein
VGNDGHGRVAENATRKPKRAYAKPTLQEYGSVAKLTQSGGSTKAETQPKSKACL